jgi:hypothetical protein
MDMRRTYLLAGLLAGTLCVSNVLGCSLGFQVEYADVDTEVACSKSCSQCTDMCCDCGSCSPNSQSCSSESTSKFTITGTAEGQANWPIWKVRFGLTAGWESQTVTTSGGTVSCNTCTQGTLWEGFSWVEETHEYGWISCETGEMAELIDTASIVQKKADGSVDYDDC